MTGAKRVAGIALALALVAYFGWFVVRALDVGALRMVATPGMMAAVVTAAVLYSLIIPVSAWAWRRLLRHQGESWPFRTLAGIMGSTQLAKYLPGNVAQHAGRALLSIKAGMGARAMTASVVQETILAIAASVIVGLAMLSLSADGLARLPDAYRPALMIAAALSGLAVLALVSVRLSPDAVSSQTMWIVRWLARAGGVPGFRVALPVLAAYSFNYLIIGLGLWLVARAMGLATEVDYPVATAVFALAWIIGFIAPGVPAGLGVREGLMLLMLAGTASEESLILFVIAARLVTVAGDGLCFLVGSGVYVAASGPRRVP